MLQMLIKNSLQLIEVCTKLFIFRYEIDHLLWSQGNDIVFSTLASPFNHDSISGKL